MADEDATTPEEMPEEVPAEAEAEAPVAAGDTGASVVEVAQIEVEAPGTAAADGPATEAEAEVADQPEAEEAPDEGAGQEEAETESGEPESSPVIKLHDLKPAPGSRKRKIRVGRGEGGRRGKTAGRGTKGQKARGNTKPGFEGGQMPLQRRVPKLKGFKNPFRVEYNVINLDVLEGFDAGTEVSPEFLKDRGLVHHKGLVKILGNGEITKALTVSANAFSRSAADKIRAAGGTAEVV